MSVDFLSKNFPPFQVHHAKKPPRFYPDGFQRNVIDFYFIFSDCRLRKALYLQFSYFIWPLDTYAGKTKELRFFIFDWKNLSNAHETLLVPNTFFYTGQPVQFEQCSVRVDSPTGPIWLEKDKDFTLSFTTTDGASLNEAPREVGTYYAVFTGKGEYTGTASTSFSIRASNDLSAAEVTCKKYYVYTGQPVQLEDLQVTLNGLVLTEGKDYTVWYNTNGYVSQDPPTGKEGESVSVSLIIRGTGAYTGEATASFEIVPPEDILNGATITGPAVYQQGTQVNTADFTVTSAEGTVLREGTDYNITFWKIIYSGGAVAGTIEDFEKITSAPTEVGTYGVVAVRTDIDPSGGQQGDKEYVPSTDIFYFSIEGNNSIALAEIQAPKTVEYTGQPVQLGLTATMGGKALVEGKDYTLRYFVKMSGGTGFAPLSGAPSAPDTYYVQLVGTGSYTGATPAGGLHEFSIQRSPALARLSPDALAIQLTEGYSEEDAKYEVKVQNTGSVAITGLAASLSGTNAADFTLDTSSLPQSLDAGQTATLTVKVNTGIGVTSYSPKMATLNVRAENLSTLSCAVSLAVTEKPTYGLTFSSSSPVFYPAQDEQNPETRAITLRNAGNTTVTLAAPPEATYCTISGFTEGQSLESGKTLTFYVTPKTNLVPGTYQENIIIRGIAPDGGIATGTLTVEVRVSEANRNVTFSTSGLNFGYWQEGQTPQERGVEIRNNGNISLSLKVELDEAVEKGFTYELRAGTDATPPVLPAPQNYQDKRSLWLYLVPKAGLPAGDYSGNVTVKDAYSGAVLGTVSVSYFAQQAQIEVTGKDGTLLATASAGNNGAATLDFGEMPYGYTPAQYSQAVTVKNTGNVAVEVGYTGGSDWLASSDSLSSTLQPGATRTMTFTVPAGKGLGQQTREPGTASGGNIWVRMQNDVQAFARVYLGYTFTVTKPATWGEWLYDAQAQTLTRLSDNLTLKNVTASGTSLTIGKQYISQSTALDLTGAVTDADGTPYTITALGVEAFWGCGSYLTAITLPDGLESIGDKAFYSCSSLTAIDIPSSVTSIGEEAFRSCTSLKDVTLPDGLESIGSYAFNSCTSLTAIEIPSSVTSIAENTFGGCTSLKDVTLPDGLESIGSYAFRDCTSLTAIEIPSSITSIGTSAFNGCTSLEAVTLLEGLQSIGVAAFRNCSALTSIDIPASVTSIGKSTFDGCTSLAAATLPEGLQSIGEYAFQHCSALTSIKIPGHGENRWDVFFPRLLCPCQP